jgi:general secretion pathway protein L
VNVLKLRPTDIPFRDVIERFLRWWVGELRELLFDHLIPSERLPEAQLLILSGPNGLTCYELRGDTRRSLGQFPSPGTDPEIARSAISRKCTFLDRSTAVHLSLSDSVVLRRRMLLPAAARGNLRQVLAYEMDRQTPFRAEQVYFDFRLVDHLTDSDELSVEFVAVPRTVLDELLDFLESVGIRADTVNVPPRHDNVTDSAGDEVNLLPPERRTQRGRRMSPGDAKLTGLVFALVVAALTVPIFKIKWAEHRLEQEIAATQPHAEQVLELRTHLNSNMADTSKLIALKEASPVVINVLAELARVLPDGTWLNTLNLQQDVLRIRGHSTASSELISVLEESPAFHKVSFVSPVTQDPKTGKEQFEIRAHIAASG